MSGDGFFFPFCYNYILFIGFAASVIIAQAKPAPVFSWRQVWEGVENKDLKYITADLALPLMPLGWHVGFGTVAWVGDRVALLS